MSNELENAMNDGLLAVDAYLETVTTADFVLHVNQLIENEVKEKTKDIPTLEKIQADLNAIKGKIT